MDIPGYPSHTWQARFVGKTGGLSGWEQLAPPTCGLVCQIVLSWRRSGKDCSRCDVSMCLPAPCLYRPRRDVSPCPCLPQHPQVFRGKDGRSATGWSLRAAQEILQASTLLG